MPPKEQLVFFTALSKQSGQHIEKETSVDEREVLQHFSFSKPIESSMTSLDLYQHTSTRLWSVLMTLSKFLF